LRVLILIDGEDMNMNDELQVSTACTKCRDAGLDMVAKRYFPPHLRIEPLVSSHALIIM
jgi:hypothetical protein